MRDGLGVTKWPEKVKINCSPFPLKKNVIFFVVRKSGLSLDGDAVEKIVLICLVTTPRTL